VHRAVQWDTIGNGEAPVLVNAFRAVVTVCLETATPKLANAE